MFMRLVHGKFKLDAELEIRRVYEEKIVTRLQSTPGCLCACLIKSDLHEDEGMSMTLWETREHAEAYEQSGLFYELLQKMKPYLIDSSEWRVKLSKELELEYQPVQEEPVVKSYDLIAEKDEEVPSKDEKKFMFLRIRSIKIKPDKRGELEQIYKEEVIPALNAVRGCRYAYLTESTEDKDEFISLTIWNSKDDADAFESSELAAQLNDKIKHTLAELYQWKISLEKTYKGQVVTSEDPTVKPYSIVAGRRFH